MKKLLVMILVLSMIFASVVPAAAANSNAAASLEPIQGITGNGGAPDLVVDPDAVFDPTGVLFDETYGFPSRLGYRTVTEVFAEMNYLAMKYPNLVKNHVIGHSAQGLPIIAVEVSNDPGSNDGRPGTLHQSVNHGGELPAIEMSMNTLWYLLTQYGVNDEVTELLDTTTCWFVPTTNPDGVVQSQRVSQHRKTIGTEDNPGVDMNRNWPYGWGSNAGSDANSSSTTYRGPYPMSSPEIQAMVSLYENNQIVTSISGHTSGQMIIYAWGHRFNEDYPTFHPDKPYNDNNNRAILQELGRELSSYNMYADKWSDSLYSATGELCDYAWAAVRALHFTIEYGRTQVPAYMGTDQYRAIASFDDAYGNPMNFLVTYTTNATLVENGAGRPAQDVTGQVAYVDDPTMFKPGYGGDHRRMTVERVEALGTSLAGKILVSPQGTDVNTTRDIILAAQNQGAVGVIFFTAGNDYYVQDQGHYNPSFGITGTSLDITIPVAGTTIPYGRELYEQSKADPAVTVTLSATQQNSESIYEVFERNIGMFMYTMKAAREYASYISGEITDGEGNPLTNATLNLESHIDYMQQTPGESGRGSTNRTSVPLPLGTLTSTHKSTYNVKDGSYSWAVVPSKQPENHEYDIPDAPYYITATANGRYSQTREVMVDWYKKTIDDINFDLPAAISTDFEFTAYLNPRNDIVVPFTTYMPNNIFEFAPRDPSGEVTALVNGEPVEVTSLGNGQFTATFNLNDLGIDFIYDCELVIDFEGGSEHSPLVLSGKDVENLDDFQIYTDAYRVQEGEYANITTEFVETINSNTAIIHYYYDTDLFEQKDFHPEEGVRVISRETTDYGAKIVVMIPGYNTQNYGRLAIQAIAPLSTGWEPVKAVVEYVVQDEAGEKEIRYAIATMEFSTFDPLGPWLEGDTNLDGVVDLIDLSNMIDWFGIDSSDSLWRSWYAFFDFNNSGDIDIYDIVHVAKKIS